MTTLFSDRSIWTMVHGIVLGGAALMGLTAALFFLCAVRAPTRSPGERPRESRALAWLMVSTAVMLWLTVLVGTYVIFPPYREAPPAGMLDLSRFPRSWLLAKPDTAWLHAFAMESKEHLSWIAAMVGTAAAFVSIRYRSTLLGDVRLRRMAATLLAVCFALVAFVALLGVFVNKVAPLQ
jgi:hypothetical protein